MIQPSGSATDFGGNINLPDDIALSLGSDTDAQIWNNGSNTNIRNNTSNQDIIFMVNDGGATETEVMRIDGSASRVGIGESGPSYKLDVAGESSAPSATSAAAAVAGFSAAAAGNELVIGNNSSDNVVWLQNRHKSSSGNKYEIKINPQGGNVSIGNADTTSIKSSIIQFDTANAKIRLSLIHI